MGFNITKILNDEDLSANRYSRIQFNIEEDVELVCLINNIDQCFNLNDFQSSMNTINTFESIYEFTDYIERNVYATLYVILAVDKLESSLSFMRDLSHVNEIYIYSPMNSIQIDDLVINCGKFRGIYNEISKLSQDLTAAINRFHRELMIFDCIPDVSQNKNLHLDQSKASFLMWRFLINCLKLLKPDEQAKKELLIALHSKYSSNRIRFKEIDNFERNYRSESALTWYSEGSLFYQTLNNVLRTHDFGSIFALRFLIQDLIRCTEGSSKSTVYRHQILSKSELERIIQTKNGFIQINNFLSTSTNRNVAVKYFREPTALDSDKIQILFEFNIEDSEFSYIPRQENEILFPIGTIFRIKEIIPPTESTRFHQVQLSSINESNDLFDVFTDWIERETYLSEDRWQQLLLTIINRNDFQLLKNIYTYLEDSSFDDMGKASKLNRIGKICYQLEDYSTAIFLETKAFELQQNYPHDSYITLIESCNTIASGYAKIQDHSNRFIWLKKALDFKRESGYFEDLLTAKIYTDLGDVCYSMENYPETIPYYKKALKIQSKSPITNYLSIMMSNKSIGLAHEALKNYSDALTYFETALKIQGDHYPNDKSSLADTYFHIADMYRYKGNLERALSFYEKQLDVEQEILPENDKSLIGIHLNIGILLIELGQSERAAKYLSQAVVIALNKCEANSSEMQNLQKYLNLLKKKE